MISVGGIRSGNSVTKTFSGALRTWAGSLTTSVFGWMRSSMCVVRDVGEVERRVLAQQHHVERGQIDVPRLAEREMVAGDVAHRERPHRGGHLAVAQRQPVGRVIGQRMAAALRFQQQRERRIAADVDPLDRVHLHGDVQAHESIEVR